MPVMLGKLHRGVLRHPVMTLFGAQTKRIVARSERYLLWLGHARPVLSSKANRRRCCDGRPAKPGNAMLKAGFGYAVCRRRDIMRCIAAGQELWFERPGFSPVPPHRPSCHARGKCRAQRDRAGHHASGGRQKKGPEQAVFLVEGAHWTMLVLMR